LTRSTRRVLPVGNLLRSRRGIVLRAVFLIIVFFLMEVVRCCTTSVVEEVAGVVSR
jgi:hypothetical protein